jgi:hypothetical protein
LTEAEHFDQLAEAVGEAMSAARRHNVAFGAQGRRRVEVRSNAARLLLCAQSPRGFPFLRLRR